MMVNPLDNGLEPKTSGAYTAKSFQAQSVLMNRLRRQCWPEPEVYCNSIIPIQTKPDTCDHVHKVWQQALALVR